jgi:hypothetical protein
MASAALARVRVYGFFVRKRSRTDPAQNGQGSLRKCVHGTFGGGTLSGDVILELEWPATLHPMRLRGRGLCMEASAKPHLVFDKRLALPADGGGVQAIR